MKKIFPFLSLLLALTLLFGGCASLSEEGIQTQITNENTKTEEAVSTDSNPAEESSHPKDDDTLYILMVGNSGCSYYCDELYKMLTGAGIKAEVFNLYYSGCRISQHLEWFKPAQEKYILYQQHEKGRNGKRDVSLQYALDLHPWDVITLQQAIGPKMAQSFDYAMKQTQTGSRALYQYFRNRHPEAMYYWHEFWAFEVGFDKPDGLGSVLDTKTQTANSIVIRQVGDAISKENNAPLIPTGSAWLIARQNPVIGDNLCKSSEKNNGAGDRYHDGQEGGGQYLNACVWFEVLTGKSCIGNSFRPDYELSEEKVAALQNAAHQTVFELYGTEIPSVI